MPTREYNLLKSIEKGAGIMKRIVSAITSISIIIGIISSFVIPITTIAAQTNLLTDGGFESGSITIDSSWKFPESGLWYGAGDPKITSDIVKTGENAVCLTNGVIGQKVQLSEGKTYTFTAKVNVTAATPIDFEYMTVRRPILCQIP